MKKLLIGLFTVFALVTLAACGGSGEDFSKSDEYNDITSDIDALQTELAKAKEDLNKAIADGNSALTEELTNRLKELNSKLEELTGVSGNMTLFSDGEYMPGTYNGMFYEMASTDAIGNGMDFYIQYISNVVVDRNGNIAGGHDDIVIPYSVNDLATAHNVLEEGFYSSRFGPVSVAGLKIEWDDVDGSEAFSTGDTITLLESIPRGAPAGTVLPLTSADRAYLEISPTAGYEITGLVYNPETQYDQIFFSVAKSSYAQHLDLLEKSKELYDINTEYLETTETNKDDASINARLDAIAALEEAIDNFIIAETISYEDIEKNVMDNTSLSYDLDFVYNVYNIIDRATFDEAKQTAQSNVPAKNTEITAKEGQISEQINVLTADKKTAISDALTAYNEAYNTEHEVDANGHINITALQAEIDALTVGTDDQQIADGNALIDLDKELTDLETVLKTDLPALNALNAKKTAISEALTAYNNAYTTTYEVDANGHIDIDALQTEIDGLTVGTDDQQIADGKALIALDKELTALENTGLIPNTKTAISEALAAYNEKYETAHELDENGHINITALQAEIDALTVGTDDQQIADGKALIDLDKKLTALETDLETALATDLPTLNAELTTLQDELVSLKDVLASYTAYDKLWTDLAKAENQLIKNYGPLWKKASTNEKIAESKVTAVLLESRINALPEVKTFIDSIDMENGSVMAQENALMDAKLDNGIKLALNESAGEFTPGEYLVDLTFEYAKLGEHYVQIKLGDTYRKFAKATAMFGFIIDENGNVAGTYTWTVTLEGATFESVSTKINTTVTITASSSATYDVAKLQDEYKELVDETKINTDGEYIDTQYEIIVSQIATYDVMGETGELLEYKNLKGFVKIGDDYISSVKKFALIDGEYKAFTWADDGINGKAWVVDPTVTFVAANKNVITKTFDAVDTFTLDFYSGLDTFNAEVTNGANFASDDKGSWSLYHHFIVGNAKA